MMLQVEQFEVERIAEHGYRLRWQPQAEQRVIAINAGTAPDRIDVAMTIDADNGHAEIAALPAAPRHFFHVQCDDGSELLLAERRLVLHGTPNFRDFGGYTTTTGQRVRWGQLFRSGNLHRLNAEDQRAIAALGINLVCDFRQDSERERAPSTFGATPPRIENLSIMPGSFAEVFSQLPLGENTHNPDLMMQIMVAINRDLALQQTGAYSHMFALLAETREPILIHCAAGKDRTGFGAALILAALGVPEATLLHDYLLTEKYLSIAKELPRLRRRYNLEFSDAALRPILEVRREYLQAAFAALHEQFGSIDTYLREALAVDDAMLRELRGRLLCAAA